MFVFPAFDSNFKSRKRTFRCCLQCRSKRKKCEAGTDPLQKGCVSCILHHRQCSFVTEPNSEAGENKSSSPGLYSSSSNPESFDTPRDVLQPPFLATADTDRSRGLDTPVLAPVSKEQENHLHTTKNPDGVLISADSQLEDLSGYGYDLVPEKFSFDLLKNLFNYSVPNLFGNVGRDFSLRSDAKTFLQEDMLIQQANGKLPSLANNSRSMFTRGLRNVDPPSPASLSFLRQIYAFTVSNPCFHFKSGEMKRLYEIYFFKINNILPMVHETKFWKLYNAGNHCTLVALAMILLVSKDNLSKPILKKVFWRSQLRMNSITESFDEFSDEQYMKALKAFQRDTEVKIRQLLLILEPYPEMNKVAKLTTNLLLSLSCGFGKFGGETCANDVDKAVTMALSMHLHIKRGHRDTLEDSGFADETRTFCSYLFWCCWLLDRFSAMINHRLMVIKKEDFNLDPPYKHVNLLRLIEVVMSFEKMCLYVYQPGYPQSIAEFIKAGLHPPNTFDLIEFETAEFEFCDNEIATNSRVYTPFLSPNDFKRSSPTYVSNTIHFLTRIINNTTISFAQELKFRDPKIDNDEARQCMLKASANILWYSKKLDDDFKMNIPLVPFILTLSLGCSLTRYANTKFAPALDPAMPHYELSEHFNELKKYRDLWLSIDGLCCMLEDHFGLHVNRKKRKFELSDCEKPLVGGESFNNTTLTQGSESAASIRNIIHLSDEKANGETPMDVNFGEIGSTEELYKLVENDFFFDCIFKSYGNE